MLAGPKLKALTDLAALLSKEELIWANGYISGLVTDAPSAKDTVPAMVSTGKKITIAYGTETGNSKKLAVDFAAKAKKKGVHAKLVSLDQYRLNDLAKEEYFVTVISTQGDGEPPIAAQKFYDHLHNNGFKVPAMKYAVLALGDTSYPMFCKTGEDVDIQLEKLGANRFYPLQKCDLDYEEEADKWFEKLLHSLDNSVTAAPKPATVLTEQPLKRPAGKKIFTGTVLANIDLNARGSDKKTFHIELAADELDFLPGDSIGVVPENDPLIVEEIIALTKIDPDKIVTYKTEESSMRELLNKKLNISFLLDKFIKQYAMLSGKELPAERIDLVQLLRNYPLRDVNQYENFILSLNAIAPRIYNIASSIKAHGSEVHIIALKDEFILGDKKSTGLCSFYFDNKKEGDEINFFIQPNKRFRLPADDKDIIMIGPGTGIAPFRSFVAERDYTGAMGRNWLFFGEEDFTRNFYYQTEWQNWFGTGVLTNINLAFNNGGDEKVTIANKLLQKATALFEWISNGAYVYLCGEKDIMSKEVEAALLMIIEQEGKLNKEDAAKYFEQLKTEGRYMKDVY